VVAPPLDSPCDGPVTYPGDTKNTRKILKRKKGTDGKTNFVLRFKEQETRLILHEHDDDDNDDQNIS